MTTKRTRVQIDDDTRVSLASLQSEVEAMETDYRDLKGAVIALSRKFDDFIALISAKLEERGRPQWTTLIMAGLLTLTVAGGFWQAGITPIKESQTKQDAAAANHERSHDSAIRDIHQELLSRNQLFVGQAEFRQLEKRFEESQRYQDEIRRAEEARRK